MGGQAIGKRKFLGQSYQGEIWEAMAPWDPKAGGSVLLVCPQTSSTGGTLVPCPAFWLFLESPSCVPTFFLRIKEDQGTEKLRFRGLGGGSHSPRSSSNSSAVTKQLVMLGSKQEQTTGDRALVRQVPPSQHRWAAVMET